LEEKLKILTKENLELKKNYEKEKLEKEEMIMMIEGKEKNVFDLIKFKQIIQENKDLKRLVEDLRFQIASEKNINQEKLITGEQSLQKNQTLNSKINKLQNTKNELIGQLDLQSTVHQIKIKKLTESKKFFETENGLLKIKIEKLIEGVSLLKNYMYESMNDEEKIQNRSKLDKLDSTITNISKNLILVKNEFQAKGLSFNKEVMKKVEEVAQKISEIKVRKEDEGEIEKLKEEIENLKEKNLEKEGKLLALEEMKMISGNDIGGTQGSNAGGDGFGNELMKLLDVDRVTNVLQKSLDLLRIKEKELTE